MTVLDQLDQENFSTPPSQDEKTMALLAHVLSLVVGIIAPLVIYFIKKDESAYVAAQAKESLNFQISILIYAIVAIPLCFILVGFLILGAVAIGSLVFVIMATIKASEGKMFRYPLTIRLIK